MTVTASGKRKTTPRKAAKRISTNGSSPPVAVNGSAPAPEPEIRPPEEFIPTTTPVVVPAAPAPPPHPYGDRKVYVFEPSDGSAPIVFPDITTLRPTYHFMWKLRKLDQVQQSFEWMDLAEVPDPIQERVAKLPDADQGRFFLGWFSPAITPPEVALPGES